MQTRGWPGIDGDRELSAAGMAYIVAQKMGDNRDLVRARNTRYNR